jgi:hypothetical protein
MNTITFKWYVIALTPAAMLILASCSSTPSTPAGERTSSAAIQKGVPGGIVVDTFKMTATVGKIDAASRKVTLVGADGKETSVKVGPEAINFDQIHVGDQVTAMVTEHVAVYMAEPGAPLGDGAATAVALAPKGAKPGGLIADTVQVTAKVSAIDLEHHKATLQFPDGSTETFTVRKDVDLTQRKVGEDVVIRSTEAVAILVEKP